MHHAFDKAEPYFKRALSLTKKSAYIHAYQAKMFRNAGDDEKYQKEITTALKEDPNSMTIPLLHMETLEPKWGGSEELMLAFYKQCSSRHLPSWLLNSMMSFVYENKYYAALDEDGYNKALEFSKQWYSLTYDAEALTKIIRTKLHIKKSDRLAALEWAEPEMKTLQQWDEYSHYSIDYLGELEMLRHHYDIGINLLTKAAAPNPNTTLGNMSAQYLLGMAYLNGNGVKADKKVAIDLLLKAEAQGSTPAGMELLKQHELPDLKQL